jgi:hypothetical protein
MIGNIIWKEVVMGCFKALYQHVPGETEENHEMHRFEPEKLLNTKKE